MEHKTETHSKPVTANANMPVPPFFPQKQKSPGLESAMFPRPLFISENYKSANKLLNKKALITGGDSGIGRAIAITYAKEGADVAITFLPEEKLDALETQLWIEECGRKCLLIPADLSEPEACYEAIETTVNTLGSLDILVCNAAHQKRKDSLEDITPEEWDKTFKVNIYANFYLAKAAVKHMKPGSCIILTSSETAHLAPKELLDYATTKGAINTFTKSLAQLLMDQKIRVNAVAPGPVWTPLNVSDEGASLKKIFQFGKKNPSKRPAQPSEIAPVYVFLASDVDSSFVNGAIIAETGGQPIG